MTIPIFGSYHRRINRRSLKIMFNPALIGLRLGSGKSALLKLRDKFISDTSWEGGSRDLGVIEYLLECSQVMSCS